MKTIKSSCGKDIIVDAEDYAFLNRHNWLLDKDGYAMTTLNSKKVSMHRLVFGTVGKGSVIDHVNRVKLDNRKENLREATLSQNRVNMKLRDNIHKMVGVSKQCNKYRFTVRHGKDRYTGYGFNTAEEAGIERDKVSYALHGDFVHLNFPERIEEYKGYVIPEKYKRHSS